MLDRLDLTGRTAVVTGGSQGIGEAVCSVLSQLGAAVWDWDVHVPDGATGSHPGPGDVAGMHVDVTDAGLVSRAFDAVVAASGSIDILVTSAGIALHGPSSEVTPEAWQRVLDTNVNGTFWCAREAAKRMSPGGSIVAVGSISGEVANTPQAQTAYNASKGAVHAIVRCLAVEFATRGVRVNAVAPGFVGTSLLDDVDPSWRQRWADMTPMGRFGRPEEIAAVVAFLAGDAASYMTGAVVPVDGGYLAW